jgi:hypothetical protein
MYTPFHNPTTITKNHPDCYKILKKNYTTANAATTTNAKFQF